jgi:hypothetical protein
MYHLLYDYKPLNFPALHIYVFRIVVRLKGDYFSKQHLLVSVMEIQCVFCEGGVRSVWLKR